MRVADVDLWGHLKFGQQIVRHREIPRHDIYSYSAYGAPWVDHEWLCEAAFYTVYSRFGDAGLFALKIGIGLLMALFSFLSLRMAASHALAVLLPFCLTFLTLGHFALFRPQLFTYLFLSVLVFALCRFHFKQAKKFLYAFPLVMVLWCNMHGGFASGLGLLFASIFVFRDERKFFLALFLVSCAATLINPYGIHMHHTVLRAVLNPATHQRIVEWKPPSVFSLDYPEYTVFLFLSLAFFLISRGWKNRFITVFYVISIILSLSSLRHIPLFAVLCAPLFSLCLNDVLSRVGEKAKQVFLFFVLALAAEFSIILFPRSFNIIVDKKLFPVECVEAAKKMNIKGNMFNPFEWGEYILFHLYPGVLVSMDGRYDTVYPWSVIEENYRVLNAESPDGLHVPLENETQFVMLSREKALTKALRHDGQWKVIHEGRTCVLLQIK